MIFIKKVMDRFIVPSPDFLEEKIQRAFIFENYKWLFPASIIIFSDAAITTIFDLGFSKMIYLHKIIMLFSVFLIPIIYIIWRRRETISIIFTRLILSLYYFLLLAVTAIMAVSIKETDFLHMYLMTVLGMSVIANMNPIHKLIVLLPSEIYTVLMIISIQEDEKVLGTTLVNIIIFYVASFILSIMIYNIRITSIINEEMILKKNIELTKLLQRDGMTGLYNHNHSFEILDREIIT